MNHYTIAVRTCIERDVSDNDHPIFCTVPPPPRKDYISRAGSMYSVIPLRHMMGTLPLLEDITRRL
jgi:hypothetical protein